MVVILGLCFYLFFMATLLSIVLMQRDVLGAYWMNQSVSQILFDEPIPGTVNKNFMAVQSVPEVWQWMSEVMVPVLENSVAQNGDPVDKTQWGRLGFINRIVGGIRLRQLRVKAQACMAMSDKIRKTFNGTCYPEYSVETASTDPFGDGDKYV